MKRTLILVVIAVLLFCAGCSSTQTRSSARATARPTATAAPKLNRGTEISRYSLESKAESYVRSQMKQTYGGYDITRLSINSTTYLYSDDYYSYFSCKGSYTYHDKKGGKKGDQSFTMKVKVYKWTLNPDHKTAITYYY